MLGKFEVIRLDRSTGDERTFVTKVVARFPWRPLAELYARLREAITPQPYHFYSVKDTSNVD